MNEIRRPLRETDEIAAIRAAVQREVRPDFITGFDVELGGFHGDPAVWIVFKRAGDDGLDIAALRERAKQMNAFTEALQRTLFDQVTDRIAFFRSVSDDRADLSAS